MHGKVQTQMEITPALGNTYIFIANYNTVNVTVYSKLAQKHMHDGTG